MTNDINNFIKNEIYTNDIVLFMKGTANSPQCGFSSMVVSILKSNNLDFKDVDVLSNEELRQAIKIYSEWPTIPQLYIKGEFIGGCDIVKEMNESGELLEFLKEKNLS